MDIKITGHRVLYSKSIAGRGITSLTSWLVTAMPVYYINTLIEYLTVILEYIDLFQFINRVQPTFGWAHP